MTKHASLAPLLERFFIQRLMQQRQASPHTIGSYRDTFRQLLKFAERTLHKPPSRLNFGEVDAPLIVAFLDDLENHQGIGVRSRNLRLTAIHSFFRYAAFEAPEHSAQIQRVLAIPSKRFTRTLVNFLTRPEVDALLAAPDRSTWSGRRDHALLLVAVQTGLRLSEITGLKRDDLFFGTGAHLRARNAALRSPTFFRYAAFEAPEHSAQIQRVLAIPSKRFTRTLVNFLTRPEVDALLAAPDRSTWSGRRDHALLLVAVQTGLRLSEITGLKRDDLFFGTGAHLRARNAALRSPSPRPQSREAG
ncbi:site-specific integrase [Mesorhizobium sp. WSM3862]|uniref:site-specific integrase n=1 Tax=Mesorhizobium sp. WSM3862 TaxID=632858 RepID=UPI001FE2163E|nr:site-specific integrase [Mesorhizobium sp. WSM3862]